jgi:hypothetical protein
MSGGRRDANNVGGGFATGGVGRGRGSGAVRGSGRGRNSTRGRGRAKVVLTPGSRPFQVLYP